MTETGQTRLATARDAASEPAFDSQPAAGRWSGATLDCEALCRVLETCETAGVGRHALLLRLSRLPREMARPQGMRLVRAALAGLLGAERAQLFRLSREPAADAVVVWRAVPEPVLQACLAALGALFADAPPAEPPAAPASLIEVLELPRDAAVLLWAIDAARAPGLAGPADPPRDQRAALDTIGLATLEARLARADVARFARRRDVCALEADGRFALRWEKRFLSVAELTQTLAPDRSARADPWLFRRLTRTLDHRMLALLAALGELRDAGPFAFNLNVASILAPEFLRFDAALPTGLRGRVMLDLLPADVLADPAAFLFARDFARARGYRLLLRGITAALLDVLPLALSGLDLLQLRWSPELQRLDGLPSDPQRLVLGHADSYEAIAWGRARGIALFTGRLAVRGAAAPTRPTLAAAPRRLALGGVASPA